MSEDRDWHVDADVLRHYRDGTLTFAGMASTEAHLTACGACRSQAAALNETPALARVKHALDEALDTPPVGFAERTLRAAGVGVTDARIITARVNWRSYANRPSMSVIATAPWCGPSRISTRASATVRPIESYTAP